MTYHIPRRRQGDAELAQPQGRACYFPPLPGGVGLDRALHGTAFIEFPVIYVFTRDEWESAVRSGAVVVMPSLQKRRIEDVDGGNGEGEDGRGEKAEGGEREAKRAKVEVSGLAGLGDYGDSDEEDEVEDEAGGEDEDEGKVDITLDPAMAAALGQALVADFGAVE